MKKIPFFFFLLFSFPLFSQSISENWVHAYLDFQNWENEGPPQVLNDGKVYTYTYSEKGVWNMNLGFYKLRENGFYHEISLSGLRLGVQDIQIAIIEPLWPGPNPMIVEGEKAKAYDIGFLIETGKTTRNWLGGFFRPGIGLGVTPELAFFRYEPKTSQFFPFRNLSIGLGLDIVPRLHFRISERFSLLAVIPFQIGTVELAYVKSFNPALPENQQSTTTTHFEIKPALDFARLGAALKL